MGKQPKPNRCDNEIFESRHSNYRFHVECIASERLQVQHATASGADPKYALAFFVEFVFLVQFVVFFQLIQFI